MRDLDRLTAETDQAVRRVAGEAILANQGGDATALISAIVGGIAGGLCRIVWEFAADKDVDDLVDAMADICRTGFEHLATGAPIAEPPPEH